MLPMLNRAGTRCWARPENLPTVYPPKNDPASKQTYLGVPTPPGNASLEAFIAKHPSRAQGGPPRPCRRRPHARAQVLAALRPPVRRRRERPRPAAHVARRPRALPGQPPPDRPGVRDEVLDDRHRQPSDLVRRVLRDVPRGVVQRDLGDERRPAEARERRPSLRAAGRGPAAADLGPARLVRRPHRPAHGPRGAQDAVDAVRDHARDSGITAAASRP